MLGESGLMCAGSLFFCILCLLNQYIDNLAMVK